MEGPRQRIVPTDHLAAEVARAEDGAVLELAEGVHRLQATARIENRRGLTIRGAGAATRVEVSPDLLIGFEVGRNVEDLTIERLMLTCLGKPGYRTHAVGSFSGATPVRRVRLQDLDVSGFAVGLSASTGRHGLYEDVLIRRCRVGPCLGVESGHGYGVHLQNPRRVRIQDTRIEGCERHSVYVGRTSGPSEIVVSGLLIVDHNRNRRNLRWYNATLCVARSSGVRVERNLILEPWSDALSIQKDDQTGQRIEDVTLLGNQIVGNRYNGIWVNTGETHFGLANRVIPGPFDPEIRPSRRRAISTADPITGEPTGSRLIAPRSDWESPDHWAATEDRIFVMKAGVLDAIAPGSWSVSTSPHYWPQAIGLAFVPRIERLVVSTVEGLWEIDPTTWARELRIPGDSGRLRWLTVLGPHLYGLRESGVVVRIEVERLGSRPLNWFSRPRAPICWMGAWGGSLLTFDGTSRTEWVVEDEGSVGPS